MKSKADCQGMQPQLVGPISDRRQKPAVDGVQIQEGDQSILLSLMSFADSTTAHGFARLVAPNGKLGSSLWLLFLLGAYAGLGYHTSTLVTKYIGHPVSTSLITDLDFQYPDIYLCNANPVGYSRITRSIANTGDYAAMYDANFTAYAECLQRDVTNNSAAQVSTDIRDTWLAWQSKILNSRVSECMARVDTCRISLQGSEFTGNYTTAVSYNKDLQAVRVPCLVWAVAKQRLQSLSPPMANLVPDYNHSNCVYNSSLNITLLKAVLGTSNGEIEYIGQVYQGPLCFFNSSNSTIGMDIEFCGAPFCNSSVNSLANCSTSLTSSISTIYMGQMQASRSGKPCLSWEALANGSLNYKFANLRSTYQFKVFLPDPDPVSAVGSSCRKAAVLYKDTSDTRGWQPISSLILDSDVGGNSWCLVETPRWKNLTRESCSVPDCSTSLKCISGLLHMKYGPQVLSKLVGPSLDINLLDCTFGSRKCTQYDFTAFHHPYYGACYQFNSESFIRGLTPMQRGLRQLNMKLFADDHDYLGNRRPDTYTAVRSVMGGPYNTGGSEAAGFYLFVLPKDIYPATASAIPVCTASHSTVRIRYNLAVDATARGVCNLASGGLNYTIYSWDPTVMRPRNEQSFARLDGYFYQFNSTNRTFLSSQEACANLAVVDTFVKQCGCLPYSLPIPTTYKDVPYCFWLNESLPTGVSQLMTQEDCAVRLFDQMETLTEESWRNCRADCSLPEYTAQITSQPWPDTSQAAYNVTLQSLTSLIGFPKQVSPDEGLAMLYYSYLRGDRLISPASIGEFGQSLAMREASRSNLAWITVEAESSMGGGTRQEDGYTLANMLAELGGILGLYCGVSVLTICELMDLAGRLVLRAAMRSARDPRGASRVGVGPSGKGVDASP